MSGPEQQQQTGHDTNDTNDSDLHTQNQNQNQNQNPVSVPQGGARPKIFFLYFRIFIANKQVHRSNTINQHKERLTKSNIA